MNVLKLIKILKKYPNNTKVYIREDHLGDLPTSPELEEDMIKLKAWANNELLIDPKG